MKKLLSLFAVGLFAISAQAVAVTIDFEEFSVGDSAASAFVPLVSKGFDIWSYENPSPAPMSIISGTNGTNALGGSITGPGQDSYGYAVQIELERSDGGAFAIYSFDLFTDVDPNGFTNIRGYLAAGGLADLSSPVGTGDWLLLDKIEFRAEGNGFGFGYASLEIDNIVVSAVPVPAAVWLFGSARAGLGWMRRK